PAARRSIPVAALRCKPPTGEEFRKMTGFSVASLVGGLAFLLYYASSSIVISHLPSLGPSEVMAYNLCQRWDPQLRDVVLALADSLTPVFTVLHAEGDRSELRIAFLSGTRHALILAIFPCLLLFMCAEPFIALWVGRQYVIGSILVLKISVMNVLVSV